MACAGCDRRRAKLQAFALKVEAWIKARLGG